MNCIFSNNDKEFMKIALEEARQAFERGDFPVGAVLVIDGKLIDKCNNDSLSSSKWISHAETTLLNRNSALIKEKSSNGAKVELYATLEPCLMCFGVAVHHRLSRIIYACPDPNAGSTHINPSSMKEVYLNMWPKISGGLMKEKSCEMMIDFFNGGKTEKWKQRNASLFENMQKNWK
ncbi:MAG: nucleoside deaminase [Candidatus Moranbacteria bacterium]|nr:nucleoside deaminase [Candidatus Moranbacteria bacterium]